jgi:hypothetical protein
VKLKVGIYIYTCFGIDLKSIGGGHGQQKKEPISFTLVGHLWSGTYKNSISAISGPPPLRDGDETTGG